MLGSPLPTRPAGRWRSSWSTCAPTRHQRGWLVAPERVYRDAGVSGLRLDRPALGRLRAVVARGDVDAIIATAPDRLARDRGVLAQLLEEFGRSGVQVIFVDRE